MIANIDDLTTETLYTLKHSGLLGYDCLNTLRQWLEFNNLIIISKPASVADALFQSLKPRAGEDKP